jgi:hypothetical protein
MDRQAKDINNGRMEDAGRKGRQRITERNGKGNGKTGRQTGRQKSKKAGKKKRKKKNKRYLVSMRSENRESRRRKVVGI